MKSDEKIKNFVNASLMYNGKLIAFPSNQVFSITEIIKQKKDNDSKDEGVVYRIQYGFPDSGCVSVKLKIIGKKGTVFDVEVYAPPADKPMITANFASDANVISELGVHFQTGVDMGTVKHSTEEEIDANPNALQMLDIAISDLNDALIIGDYNVAVEKGSEYYPTSGSTTYPNKTDDHSQSLN